MKIVRFIIGNKVGYGILDGESIQGIEGKPFRSIKPTGQYYKLSKVKLLSPCLPSKIVALGLNYRAQCRRNQNATAQCSSDFSETINGSDWTGG